ncbi:hypothetical protein PMAYCL1PPCAC_27408, partial [Pristionchus mayeri]
GMASPANGADQDNGMPILMSMMRSPDPTTSAGGVALPVNGANQGNDMPFLRRMMNTPDAPEVDNNPGTFESLLNDGSPLEASPLGDAVDHLLLTWTQLFSNVATKYPGVPPSLNNIKETAVIATKDFREACVDLSAEFAKVAVEWQLENVEAAEDDRVAALKSTIAGQDVLLIRAQATNDLRTEAYFRDSLVDGNSATSGPSQQPSG